MRIVRRGKGSYKNDRRESERSKATPPQLEKGLAALFIHPIRAQIKKRVETPTQNTLIIRDRDQQHRKDRWKGPSERSERSGNYGPDSSPFVPITITA